MAKDSQSGHQRYQLPGDTERTYTPARWKFGDISDYTPDSHHAKRESTRLELHIDIDQEQPRPARPVAYAVAVAATFLLLLVGVLLLLIAVFAAGGTPPELDVPQVWNTLVVIALWLLAGGAVTAGVAWLISR